MSKDREAENRLTEEPFLSRWSKRKLAQPPVASPDAQAPAEEPQTTPLAELTDADMPPLESLDENADYSGFLSPKVSEGLRQQALQVLFRSAAFNVCDGLDDYAEDFTRFEKLGEVVTAELRFRLEQEARRVAQRDEALGEPEPQESPSPTLAEREELANRSGEALPSASAQNEHHVDSKDNELT